MPGGWGWLVGCLAGWVAGWLSLDVWTQRKGKSMCASHLAAFLPRYLADASLPQCCISNQCLVTRGSQEAEMEEKCEMW